MILLYSLTVSLVLLYLIYPLWLLFLARKPVNEAAIETGIDSISFILLSHNGQDHLKAKIESALQELALFKQFEIIIVDDCSTDSSREILNSFAGNSKIRIIFKDEQKGIAHSMNIGVAHSTYNTLIFCDQRQHLCKDILQGLVNPLQSAKVGAVSASIVPYSKSKCHSIIRGHENFLKINESKTGNLIGVYGPLYAVKKKSYTPIPEYIILDDLYLSLKILRSKQIKIVKECRIIDEDFSVLYDYQRTRRYLHGFLQILNEKSLVNSLNTTQKVMLLWHKYLRLLIPFFLFASYLGTGIMGIFQTEYTYLFLLLNVVLLFSFIPDRFNINFKFKNIIRLNVYYFFAFFDILMKWKLYFPNKRKSTKKLSLYDSSI